MAIIGTLPNNITNGQAVDANPVMADFNFIVNQVNANANPLGTLTAPAGTVMPFAQASAPLGWVASTDAAHTDAVMRCIVPGSYVGTQGANAVGPLFLGSAATDGHALSTAELAVHAHTDSGHTHGTSDPGHAHAQNSSTYYNFASGGQQVGVGSPINLNLSASANTASAATGVGVNLASANIQSAGSGTAHTHTLTNFNYKIVDYILCTKS